jgi:hypothetical protein
MSKLELYMEHLTQEGYRPEVDHDGDVRFKKEGGTYYLMVEEQDERYFRLIYPNFWSLETPEERAKALEAMGAVNANLKVVKVYPVNNDTTAAVELFLEPHESFKLVFERCIRLVQEAVSQFRGRMRETN